MQLTQTTAIICPEVERMVTELHMLHDVGMPKISTIKSLRFILGLGLKECKELYEVVIEGKPIEETVLTSL